MGAWVKRREVVYGARNFRSVKLRCLESKRVGWDGGSNFKHIWKQVKRVIVKSASETCCSSRRGEKNPKSVRGNDVVKIKVERKEVL